MTTVEQRVASAANGFVAAARDAADRHASINHYLFTIFAEISPADLTAGESAAVVEALESAFLRVTGMTINHGVASVPRIQQLREVLSTVSPSDLTPSEAIVVLTLLVPVHSRVISARNDGAFGRPMQRLLLDSLE